MFYHSWRQNLLTQVFASKSKSNLLKFLKLVKTTDFQIQWIPELINSIQRLWTRGSRDDASDLDCHIFPFFLGAQ